MNRPPGPTDGWYARHQENCGGEFVKIAGPPEKEKDGKGKGKAQKNKIIGWLKGPEHEAVGSTNEQSSSNPIASGSRKRRREMEDDGEECKNNVRHSHEEDSLNGSSGARHGGDDDVVILGSNTMVVCPVCFEKVWENRINQHLDNEHGL